MNKSFGTPGLERNALAKGKHLEDDHIALGDEFADVGEVNISEAISPVT